MEKMIKLHDEFIFIKGANIIMTDKKSRLAIMIAVLLCLTGILGLTALYVREYRRSAFLHLSAFCGMAVEENPKMEEALLASVKKYYNSYGNLSQDGLFLEQYGYKSEALDAVLPAYAVVVCSVLSAVSACGLFYAVWRPYRYSRARAESLTDYLGQINTGGGGTILPVQEDGFSHLQDEIYKTVTELYRTREQAVTEKLNYADNLANIAHQLKTPVTAAHLALQLMEETKNEEKTKEYAGRVRRQLERMNGLEEALLTLSKIDAGALHMECTEVDIYTVLNLAADNLYDLLSQKGVTVFIPEQGCATFRGDMEWTMEALMNLIKNCMEHSGEGGRVYCDYSVNPLYAQIRIWDDGTGFSEEDIPHLFERFYRGKDADGKGIGLGLPLARSIFDLQNGIIAARNLPQGGACFEIKIYRQPQISF